MSEQFIVLLTPKVPPTRDGVGDYTYHLGLELSKTHKVFIFTAHGQQEGGDGDHLCVLPVVPRYNMWGMLRLLKILKKLRPSLINVQWVPFLWGKGGINPWIALGVLWMRLAGFQVVTTVHEPYVPFTNWKSMLIGVVQRLELWLMIVASSKIAVSISVLTQMFQRQFPWRRKDIFWLPVGSNIPKVSLSEEERRNIRSGLGIGDDETILAVFSPLGSGKLVEWIYQTWAVVRENQRTVLLVIGREREEVKQHYPFWDDRGYSIYTGYLDPTTVSRYLSCADLLIAPFIDGISTRRGSVISALEHGLPVVTTRGILSDNLFEGSPVVLTPVGDLGSFICATQDLINNPLLRRRLSEETRCFWEEHFCWRTIAEQLLRAVTR